MSRYLSLAVRFAGCAGGLFWLLAAPLHAATGPQPTTVNPSPPVPVPEPGRVDAPVIGTGSAPPPALGAIPLEVPPGRRVLVVAPHPDDETLGTGGLIEHVRAAAGTVHVVFVTNGDGYPDGVRHEVRRPAPDSTDFVAYGDRRHHEALAALAAYGLRPADASFLGFPDDGIGTLWTGSWSARHPYRSPYTHATHPPYADSVAPEAPYTGGTLQKELSEAIRRFRPDWLIVPDPRDTHPDHSASGLFALAAAVALEAQPRHGTPLPQIFTYVIHAPNYPATATWVDAVRSASVGGVPSGHGILATAPWRVVQLSRTARDSKTQAIAAYATQGRVMRGFLQQFLRPYELFARLDRRQVTAVLGASFAAVPARR